MMKKLIPQDLNPETMKKYLADLRTLENSIKAGYKEGTWTKGVIEEFEKGGRFSNDGFKSLPLQVQQQIMKGANKKALGGADTVDPAEVAKFMKYLNSVYMSNTNIDRKNPNFKPDPSEIAYLPGSPEYDAAYKQMLNDVLAGNPTDTYEKLGGRDYSRENVYAAYTANPPSQFITSSQFLSPAPIFDTPPSIKNVQLKQMPSPPVQTVPPRRDPGVRAANTGELMDRPLMFEGQDVDYTYKQFAEEFANDPARLQAAQEQGEIMDANRKALGTLTPEQQEEARKLGLTATEYLNQRTFGTKEGRRFDNGGNMHPNFFDAHEPIISLTESQAEAKPSADYPSMYVDIEPLNEFKDLDLSKVHPKLLDFYSKGYLGGARYGLNPNYIPFEEGETYYDENIKDTGLPAYDGTFTLSDKNRQALIEKAQAELANRQKTHGGNMYPNGSTLGPQNNPLKGIKGFMNEKMWSEKTGDYNQVDTDILSTVDPNYQSSRYGYTLPAGFSDKYPSPFIGSMNKQGRLEESIGGLPRDFGRTQMDTLSKLEKELIAEGKTEEATKLGAQLDDIFQGTQFRLPVSEGGVPLEGVTWSKDDSHRTGLAMKDAYPNYYKQWLAKQNSNVKATGGMMNQYAMGAQMPQGQMTDIPTTEFNAGGSHEANPMGGVYQGMASNGKPNLVEQGELKITIPGTDDQFIVSPKIKLDKATAEEFGLSKKHVGKDMVKIFKSLLRKNNFAEREGDSIVENSKQLEIMPYVAAHQKLTEIANAKDEAKKQEAFDKDMTQMMEKHPEYMQALMAQSQQPMEQQGPSPEEMAMMEQQGAMQGGMPPMMATYGGNIARNGLWANIHAKRKRIEAGSEETMRKKGSKGAPTEKALKNSRATGGYMNYAQGGKMPKDVLRARAESHMSKEAADAYVNNYEYGTNMYANGGDLPNKVLTYKNDSKWFDSHARYHDNPEYNDQIRKRVYSGKWGYNPSTGELIKLATKQQTEVSAEKRKQALTPKVDAFIPSTPQKAQYENWWEDPTYEPTQEEMNEFIRMGYDKANTAFRDVASSLPGVETFADAIGFGDAMLRGDTGDMAIYTTAAALPFIPGSLLKKAKDPIDRALELNPPIWGGTKPPVLKSTPFTPKGDLPLEVKLDIDKTLKGKHGDVLKEFLSKGKKRNGGINRGSFNNPGFNAPPTEVQNKIKANSMGYGSNMYGYGSNMYNFGSTLGAGIAGVAKGVVGSIPGVGGMLEQGIGILHNALDKDITDQDKMALGLGESVGAIGTTVATGGATLGSSMDNILGGAAEGASNIPGMGEGGQKFLEGVNQMSGLAGMIPMRYGGKKYNTYNTGSFLENNFNLDNTTPSFSLEDLMMQRYNTNVDGVNPQTDPTQFDASLEEGIKEVNVEGGWGSQLAQLAPIAGRAYAAFSPTQQFSASDFYSGDIIAPSYDLGESVRQTNQAFAGANKGLGRGPGYMSNRVLSAVKQGQSVADILAKEEQLNEQARFQTDAMNKRRLDQARSATTQAQLLADATSLSNKVALADTVGSYGKGKQADQIGAGYADISSEDIRFRYNPWGKSFLGKVKTNKDTTTS